MSHQLRWGILGTGRIAGIFAEGIAKSKTGTLVAVGSRAQESADAFAKTNGAARAHGSYEALLADPEVDAIYISTPHPLHAEWAIKTAEAGKHVLCEKPLALNHPEAMAIVEAARRAGVFLMEAFMYRCHPQTAKIAELVRDKVVGDAMMVQASFGFRAGFNPESRLLNNALGGGGILDVGCYPVSMARMIAGAVAGLPFDDPEQVSGAGQIGAETRVDEYATASLSFRSGLIANVSCAVRLRLENELRIFGTEGKIVVPSPWIMGARHGTKTSIFIHRDGADVEEIKVGADLPLYALEADHVAAHVADGQATAMSWADTLGNMLTLDRWRESISFVYDAELPANQTETVSRRPLARRADHGMTYGQVAGVDKPVSRLIIGVDNQPTDAHAAVIFDDFIEQGGNTFDTAYIYASGKCERLLGHWLENRGIREEVVVIGKGAHTPDCTPAALTRQLMTSLSRLKTGYVDIYMLHRDNPEVPAGEFVEVLNAHLQAGRMRAFGGSNWSMERIDEANDYARKHGLAGFSVVSNNFSLARMVDPVWPGCISASGPAWRAWLVENEISLLAWSSQARGFFTERAALPEAEADPQLVRCWFADDNFRRRERTMELAGRKGVLPINVALAYVLRQPFPTFSLIGPRTLEETRTSLPGLRVELTDDELRWLNLEE